MTVLVEILGPGDLRRDVARRNRCAIHTVVPAQRPTVERVRLARVCEIVDRSAVTNYRRQLPGIDLKRRARSSHLGVARPDRHARGITIGGHIKSVFPALRQRNGGVWRIGLVDIADVHGLEMHVGGALRHAQLDQVVVEVDDVQLRFAGNAHRVWAHLHFSPPHRIDPEAVARGDDAVRYRDRPAISDRWTE